ncbi:MAG TPA: PspA/IM30 family protein [Candidatus Micrarchaeia archaeon]|nr:PspA/IM30 family protein [Candidatus Micrarchaeia archaeon]
MTLPDPLLVCGLAGGAGLTLLAARTVGRRARAVVRQRSLGAGDPQEDPIAAVDLAYRRQVASLQEVRRGIAAVVTAEKRLELQAQGLERTRSHLQTEARSALGGGREDLCRLALTRAEVARGQLEQLAEQRRQLRGQAERLQATVLRLGTRVAGVRGRRDTLLAQYAAARARVQAGESLTGLGPDAARRRRRPAPPPGVPLAVPAAVGAGAREARPGAPRPAPAAAGTVPPRAPGPGGPVHPPPAPTEDP